MVHLFLDDGKHIAFKSYRIANSHEVPKPEDNLETLFMWAEYIGYFETLTMFKFIPIGRVKEIHVTRQAGERFQGGA